MHYDTIEIEKYTHDTFKLKGSLVVYIDPYKIEDRAPEPADVIVVTHEHFDHCSPADMRKIAQADKTVIVGPAEIREKVEDVPAKEVVYMKVWQKWERGKLTVQAWPAYNIGKDFHPKTDNKLGYVISLDGVALYHAGDSDFIPEMEQLKGKVQIALLPVSGTYVMNWQEAVKAADAIQPDLVIPMHYGVIVGSSEDALKFKEHYQGKTEIW